MPIDPNPTSSSPSITLSAQFSVEFIEYLFQMANVLREQARQSRPTAGTWHLREDD